MKGHTKIELTNQKTGEVKIIEHDNTITNWFNITDQTYYPEIGDAYFKARDLTNFQYSNKGTRGHTPRRDFGGVIAFKEQLKCDPQDMENFYPKEPMTMTAHATDDAYTGTDLSRGSMNTLLTTYDTELRTATFVWDFTMEQGNGQIGTICLCNHNDGQIGYGSKFPVENTCEGKAPFYHHVSSFGCDSHYISINGFKEDYGSGATFGYAGGTDAGNEFRTKPVWIDYEDSCLVLFSGLVEYGEMLFYRVPLNLSKSCPIRTRSHGQMVKDNTHIERVHVPLKHCKYNAKTEWTIHRDLPCTMESYMVWSGLDFKGNFWYSEFAAFSSDEEWSADEDHNKKLMWKANQPMIFTKLNLVTFEETEYPVVNTTGHDMWINGTLRSANVPLCCICVVNNYLFIEGNDAHMYAINLSDNADVHEVENGVTQEPMTLWHDARDKEQYKNKCCGAFFTQRWGDWHGSRSKWGLATCVLGDKLIFSTHAGLDAGGDDNMWIVDTVKFIAMPMACSSLCKSFNDWDLYYQSTTNFNSGNCLTYPLTDYPVTLQWDSHNTSPSWNSDGKCWVSGDIYMYDMVYLPMALFTINTLPEVVTKTADMTMRITYTITADNPIVNVPKCEQPPEEPPSEGSAPTTT